MDEKNQLKELCGYITKAKLNRKKFLRTSAFVGGSALFLSGLEKAYAEVKKSLSKGLSPEIEYELAKAQNTLYTVCLQCNTGCGIKVKVLNGLAVKVEGSPLSPWTLTPHLPYKSSVFDITNVDGAICPKGHAGIQTLYDPYRITKVLKRAVLYFLNIFLIKSISSYKNLLLLILISSSIIIGAFNLNIGSIENINSLLTILKG